MFVDLAFWRYVQQMLAAGGVIARGGGAGVSAMARADGGLWLVAVRDPLTMALHIHHPAIRYSTLNSYDR